MAVGCLCVYVMLACVVCCSCCMSGVACLCVVYILNVVVFDVCLVIYVRIRGFGYVVCCMYCVFAVDVVCCLLCHIGCVMQLC